MKIKSMKELKRQYRVAFNELKDLKNEANFTQQAIDTAKTQLVNDFELWYSDNFTSAMQQAESALGSFNDQNNLNTSTLSNKKSTSPLKVIITTFKLFLDYKGSSDGRRLRSGVKRKGRRRCR